jgi:hypothetical protein
MPDNTLSTLSQIKTKVRRLTRSLSSSQLSDTDLEQYINQFLLYDFPEHLRHQNFHTVLTFYTEPYVDTYDTNTTDATDPLYNFKNRYITVNPPAYISGYQALWVQSENQLYGIYPKISSIQSIGAMGDGATVSFSGNIDTNTTNVVNGNVGLILAGSVLFESQDANGLGISLIDYPAPTPSNIIGALAPVGYTGSLAGFPYGQINYITGQFNLTFTSAPASGATINSQTVLTQPSIPQTIMFFDGKFIVRPVPDQVYRIQVEAYVRPTELLSNSQQPELAELWEYIAYGAAKKVFEDRMDTDSIQQILPEYKNREKLVNRRTVVQQTNQRVSSIYTEQTGGAGAYGAGWFSGGGLF